MRKLGWFAVFLGLSVSALAMPPLPRKAPEITVVEPSGKQTLLSSFKGKVVVLSFVYTTCPHCQAFSAMVTNLERELGPGGFQPLGIAFNDNAGVLVPGFIQQAHVGYPVGFASPDTVLSYLGFSIMDRYVVPQIVVIDRKGMIRAQTPPQGDPNLQDPAYLHKLVDSLLKEGARTTTSKAKSAPKKAS